jgi:hypothetical protein
MLCRRGDDVQTEGPNPLSSVRVRPVYSGYALAVRRCPTHHPNVAILGFRFTALVTRRVKPARSLAFRRTPPGFRLAPARSFTFRRPAARFRLTPGVAVAKTAVVPPPSRVATS